LRERTHPVPAIRAFVVSNAGILNLLVYQECAGRAISPPGWLEPWDAARVARFREIRRQLIGVGRGTSDLGPQTSPYLGSCSTVDRAFRKVFHSNQPNGCDICPCDSSEETESMVRKWDSNERFVPRSPVADFDETSRKYLHGDPGLSEVRAVRPCEPDEKGCRLDTEQHCRRKRMAYGS